MFCMQFTCKFLLLATIAALGDNLGLSSWTKALKCFIASPNIPVWPLAGMDVSSKNDSVTAMFCGLLEVFQGEHWICILLKCLAKD